MEQIEGIVENIIYQNKDTGYTVLELSTGEELLTSVGSFNSVSIGENICVKGEYVNHPLYGKQLKAISFKASIPNDIVSLERYLSSGAIKGVGPSIAHKIIQTFKDDTKRVIEEEPELLSKVKGISGKKAQDIAYQFEEKRDLRDAMIFLSQYGINGTLAVKLYKVYEDEIYYIIKQNPYKLSEDVRGIGFKTADEIARKVGIEKDSEFRIKSAVEYILYLNAEKGNTYMKVMDLFNETKFLLDIEIENDYFETLLSNMVIDRRIKIEHSTDVYLNYYYKVEAEVAKRLLSINASVADLNYEKSTAEDFEKFFKEKNILLDEMQLLFIKKSIENGVSILTGGPGTGKTTTINGIIQFFGAKNLKISLAAPTGRAAKRMSETTGYEAKTIHRLLEVNGVVDDKDGSSHGEFLRNEENPLETDVVIVDEMSMVDISLFNSLLKAIPLNCRLVMVGDIDQLPSVGPGNVLHDIIASERFSTVKLEKIFRQAMESDIVKNAHKVNNGEKIKLDNKSSDFFFIEESDAMHITARIWRLLSQKLPKYVDAKTSDIQVITPMKKGNLGTYKLNEDLQRALNPKAINKKEYELPNGKILREHDKVMQNKNDYKLDWIIKGMYDIPIETGKGVFNGDIGEVIEIDKLNKKVEVLYDENRYVKYDFTDLDEIELAYAITIHKSQGSEYPAIVIPILDVPRLLSNRNLLYTAITRAKKCVVIVGSEKALNYMIQNKNEVRRQTGLCEKLINIKENPF